MERLRSGPDLFTFVSVSFLAMWKHVTNFYFKISVETKHFFFGFSSCGVTNKNFGFSSVWLAIKAASVAKKKYRVILKF